MKHWFECIEDNLNKMNKKKRAFILSLIKNPFNVSKKEIKEYIPYNLAKDFLLSQKNFFFAIKNQQHFLKKHVYNINIKSYFIENNKEKIILNQYLIESDYLERIKEDLAKFYSIELDSFPIHVKINLYVLYAITDLIIYNLLGIITISSHGYYILNKEYTSAYKMIWFSRFFTQQSHFFDFLTQKELDKYLISRKSPTFQYLVDTVLDKHLSLHPNYCLYLENKDKDIFLEMRNIAEFITYLSLQFRREMKSNNNPYDIQKIITKQEIESFGFSEEDIRIFFEKSLNISKYNHIADKTTNTEFKINNINLKFALQTYLSDYLSNMKGRGIWFEVKYILNYLKNELDKNRFIITKGINSQREKYDSDIIIYDKNSKLIYFCQIKHRIKTTLPFFRDEFYEYYQNEAINKGIKQLCTLREKILTKQVKDKLTSRLGKKAIDNIELTNYCRFILIHSIENLDMCTKNNISMYEWNTFRNLLKGESSYLGNNNFIRRGYNNKNMDFTNITDIQKSLIEDIENLYKVLNYNNGPAKQWELLKESRVLFRFNTAIYLKNKLLLKSKWKYWDIPLII